MFGKCGVPGCKNRWKWDGDPRLCQDHWEGFCAWSLWQVMHDTFNPTKREYIESLAHVVD